MKILLADPSPAWISHLRDQLSDVPGAAVVAQSSCEEHAVITAALCRPDVVICDVTLCNGSGLNAVARMRKAGFCGAAYVVSNADETLFGPQCVEAGVDGFYDRAHDLDLLIEALRVLADAPLTFHQPKFHFAATA